ncbi:MAG: hypothetical protein ABII88_09020 [Candidatus Omnitrophota bacterium]
MKIHTVLKSKRLIVLVLLQVMLLSSASWAQTADFLSPALQVSNQSFIDSYELLCAGFPDEVADASYADLLFEGYSTKIHKSFDAVYKISRVTVEIFADSGNISLGSQISFLVCSEMRLIILEEFHPNFPQARNGRGRALLRFVLTRPEYAGYSILANASEPFQRSFSKMYEYEPLVFINEGSSALKKSGEEILVDLESHFNLQFFIERPELFEHVREYCLVATLFGVVPSLMVQEELRPLLYEIHFAPGQVALPEAVVDYYELEDDAVDGELYSGAQEGVLPPGESSFTDVGIDSIFFKNPSDVGAYLKNGRNEITDEGIEPAFDVHEIFEAGILTEEEEYVIREKFGLGEIRTPASFAAISRELEISPRRVKTVYARALGKIRSWIRNEGFHVAEMEIKKPGKKAKTLEMINLISQSI